MHIIRAMRRPNARRVLPTVSALVFPTLATLVTLAAMPHAVAAPPPAPAAGAAAKSDEARAAFVRGNTAYNLGKYSEAIADFEQAYALSRLPEILFNLGQCYRKQWDAEKKSALGRRALHYYETLVREAPTSRVRPDAEQFIAELAPAVAAAESRERQGLIAAARGADALRLAQTSFTAGQLQEAGAILDRLLREPDNGRELLAEAYLLRGRVAAASGDLLGAEVQFRRALELRPSAEIADPRGQEVAALEAARKTVPPGGLRLVQTPLGELPARQPAALAVKVEGDGEKLVSTLELGYRQGEAGAFLTSRATPPAPLVIPEAALPPGARVDYYVRALDAHGGDGRRERDPCPAVPAAGRGAAPAGLARAAALVREVVGLDAGRRRGGRRRRGHLRRDPPRRSRAGDRGTDEPMIMRPNARLALIGTFLCGLACGVACSSSTNGLKVDIDPASYGLGAVHMDVVISVTGGFMPKEAFNVEGVTVWTEDRNGDTVPELVARFNGPFDKPFSFHLDTQNQETLQVDAVATVFNNDKDLYAGGSGSGELAPGGHGAVSITLGPQSSPVGADTRTTDLKTAPADLAVTSTSEKTPHLSSVAVCNLNGDQYADIVVGAPSADPDLNIGPTGAVYLLMGGSTARTAIDVDNPAAQDVRIFGVSGGDQLGAAVGCADVDGDTLDDLFIGAPGADFTGDDNAGKIYMLRGGNFAGAAINLASATSGATIAWHGAAGNRLGTLLAVNTVGTATLLASAPGAMTAHLLPVSPGPTRLVVDASAPDHFRVVGVVPTALGFGDFDGNSASSDIVIGDSQYRAPADGADRRGAVYVFSAVDPAVAAAPTIASAAVMIPGPDAGSQFGAAVLAFDSGRGQDLLIGAPGASDAAGAVYLFQNGSDFFEVTPRSTTEQSVRVLAAPDGGRFGGALAASRLGTTTSGVARLVVGAPEVTRGDRTRAGAAYTFSTNSDRAFRLREQLYGAAANGLLGSAVAGGQVNSDDTIGDLVAVAPEMANVGGMSQSGAVYVRYGTP